MGKGRKWVGEVLEEGLGGGRDSGRDCSWILQPAPSLKTLYRALDVSVATMTEFLVRVQKQISSYLNYKTGTVLISRKL